VVFLDFFLGGERTNGGRPESELKHMYIGLSQLVSMVWRPDVRILRTEQGIAFSLGDGY
jgi:hypothetical protein